MYNWIVKYILLILIPICFYRCTDLLTSDGHEYNSIRLTGGSWIEFQSTDIAEILNNDFSFQIWISADTESDDEAKALLSVLDANNEVHFALYRNTSNNNSIDLYLDDELTTTISDEEIDWSSLGFDLFTITYSLQDQKIKIYINQNLGYEANFTSSVNRNLIIGARVNDSQTNVNNFWYGYIDEMRLWSSELTAEKIAFHSENPSKLVSAAVCSDPTKDTEETCTDAVPDSCSGGTSDGTESNQTQCDDVNGTWNLGSDNTLTWDTGTYSDDVINTLSGLWRFNYENPTSNIHDEKCQELNLGSGASGTIDCLDINGTVYTIPESQAEFSNFGL